jgi:V8-like Glu-specific endopeptidase
MIATGGPPVEAQKVIVTPGQDGAKLLGKQRTPVGSVELKPGDWWMPNQYLATGSVSWNVAVLTLPSELPLLQGMTYGHWSDPRFNPRTTIAATTTASLGGATVSVCGYPADKRSASTQWDAFAKVQPGFVGVESTGAMVYDVESSTGTLGGAPVWQKNGGLRLVAIHLFDDAKLSNPKTYQPEVHSVALVMRAEIVDALRQRIVIERIPPTF